MSGLCGMFDAGVASKPLDGLAGMLVGGVIMVLVYGFAIWSLCMTSAQLITQFPRTVLNMISFAEPGLNPYEQVGQGIMGDVGGTLKSVASGRGLIGQQVTKGLGRLMGPRKPTPGSIGDS